MAYKFHNIDPSLTDPSVINRGLKILHELKKTDFPKEYILYAAIYTGFRSTRLAAEWIASHLNDPLLNRDVEVDFHVYLSVGEKFGSDASSFLSAARTALGWFCVFDGPTQIPLLHLRSIFVRTFGLLDSMSPTSSKMFELLVDTEVSVTCRFPDPGMYALLKKVSESFLQNLSQAGLNFRIISNSCKSNYSLTLVNNITNCSDKISVLNQLREAYFRNSYNICESNQQPVDHQLKFCLYSHDPRLNDSDQEVFEMLTDVETDNISPLISSYVENGSTKAEEVGQKSADFSTNIDNKLKGSCNISQLQCDNRLIEALDCSTRSSPGCQTHILSHYAGDYVLLTDSICLNGRLGCPFGINLCTGESGLFNMLAGRRIPRSQTWTLHCSVPVNSSSVESCSRCNCTKEKHYSEEFKRQISQNSSLMAINLNSSCPQLSSSSLCFPNSSKHSFTSSSTSSASGPTIDPEDRSTVQSGMITNITNTKTITTKKRSSADSQRNSYLTSGPTSSCSIEFQPTTNNMTNDDLNHININANDKSYSYQHIATTTSAKRHSHTKSRQMYVMRHAERLDISFGHAWVTQCFDHRGVYRRFNLNLPPWLPPRSDCLEYILDSPITQVGLFVSAETGRALADAGVYFTACYCSPAFRCVQTACELLRAMGRSDLAVRIEPHLFEWYGWYVGGCAPKMMTVDQLKNAGYNVDTSYKPLSAFSEKDIHESIQGYFNRTAVLVKRILNVHKSKDTCLLIVAHASSLDTCTRHLVYHGLKSNLSADEFQHRTSIVPYCGLLLAQEDRRWKLVDPPVPNVCSYARNSDFDWKQLLGPTLCNFKVG
ncbi:unnamed protein product [Heterobilharzia americana]|nr:unnamed protein product [Heterobilharzia americana]